MNKEKKPRKFLVVLNYWNGDREMVINLANLICDLEPKFNDKVDIMFYRRWDANVIPAFLCDKMKVKFEEVHQFACRRRNAIGYPYGANEMFYDLLETMGNRDWQTKYFAFLNMEPDCCPLSRDWLDGMLKAYDEAYNEGKSATGHVHTDRNFTHLNGASIYSTDFWYKAGGMNIIGGPISTAYDIYHRQRIMPLTRDSNRMLLDFNRKTISEEDLFSLRKNGESPVYLHGVKDMTAIMAVRSRFLPGGSEQGTISKIRTVCTYFDADKEVDQAEQKNMIEMWKLAWKNAGYNPVVLEEWDASKNERYVELKAKLKDMKSNGPRRSAMAKLYRWLAFAHQGSGLFVEYDVFPNPGMAHEDIPDADGFNALEMKRLSAVSADRRATKLFVEEIMGFDYQSCDKIPDDVEILMKCQDAFWLKQHDIVKGWNSPRWAEARMIHFSTKDCKSAGASFRKTTILQQFLKQG
jgi:hypothetical protein